MADFPTLLVAHRWSPAKDDARGGCFGCAYHGDYAGWIEHIQAEWVKARTNESWSAEHSAKAAPLGTVLYDDDDDLFTVKAANGKWVAYYSQGHLYSLTNADIDGDRGDQVVGVLNHPERDR